MKIVIIQYNAGNIHSVRLALKRLGHEAVVSEDLAIIKNADKVIFPGVGEASTAMAYLSQRGISDLLPQLRQPVLGICLGLALMCKHSQEADTACLGIFDTLVKKFPPTDKVPHMGWNNLVNARGKLFEGLEKEAYVYFVHSYYAELDLRTSAGCDYSVSFSAAMEKDNFYAVQFHPEKSGKVGERILQNFLEIK
jgi:glutamine amidotransferase